MTLFWPPGSVQSAVAKDDEYDEVAGDIPQDGDVMRVRKVEFKPDLRYPTNGFLVVSYGANKFIRFRMKKSTAKYLQVIMESMLPGQPGFTRQKLVELGVRLADGEDES